MKLIRSGFLLAFISILSGSAFAQAPGSIAGSVTDSLGAIVVGATVTAVLPTGQQKPAITNARGEYVISGLAPGNYTVKAIAPNFALYENTEVTVTAGERNELPVILTVSGVEENVEVSNGDQISTDPDANLSATVLKGADLDALPDDPDELQAALQALAGAGAGPNGGQIYIDGFTGGQLPPKEAIREIRINQNPFSAEYDRLGMGRIEILTRPGFEKWRGSAFGNFNDESLNSRNPFALNRAPTQMRALGGSFGGPIAKGKTSFNVDASSRSVDNNAIINALILDPALNIIPFQRDLTVPTRVFQASTRVDHAINPNNTLGARYSFNRRTSENQGLNSGLALPSVASESKSREHEIRLTYTSILNSKTINETRFEYSDNLNERLGDNSIPTINVSSAFTGGGAQVGNSFTANKVFEINNSTTTTLGRNSQHGVKFGARIRRVNIDDRSESGFGGTFTYSGVSEVRSPAGCFPVGPGCVVVTPAITPLEQYRGEVSGSSDERFNPTQFSITTGNPLVSVSQVTTAFYVTDDWRINPSLLLSFGLRYENQTNIDSNFNFAPRFGFAWSPGAGGASLPKTVFRGGAGIFYDRFSENTVLTATRFNGTNQLNLLVTGNDPDPVRRVAARQLLAQPIFTLNGVTNVPTAAQVLAALPQSNTIRQIDPDLQSPYTMQAALSVERQLPYRTSMSVFLTRSRTLHVGRLRNINAPICPLQIDCLNAPRPQPTLGGIYEYEASGIRDESRMFVSLRTNFNPRFSLFGNYSLGFAKSDADGFGSFPAYSYDFAGEYGRAGGDIRHNAMVMGTINAPWGISLSPHVIFRSGLPFNITRGGIDINGDGIFNERPTYGVLSNRCNERRLNHSFCDIGSNDPNAIIPRNYGEGPSFFTVNMRVGKNFGFGKSAAQRAASSGGGGGGGRGPGMMGGGGGGRGPGGGGMGRMGGSGGFREGRKPYNLNVNISINNLFNNVNFNPPVGNLSSSRFGQNTSTSGGFGGFGGGGGGGGSANRRIELQTRFSW
ncbi:hypothetical protein BH20ACI2_BH20ACI2_13460 [soil metagenome]